jgi:lysophospholipase L1-like esterase
MASVKSLSLLDAPGAVSSIRQVDARYPALATFRTALTSRASSPVDILCIGDSLTEGIGATTRANRWVEKLRDQLRARYPTAGVAGGEGFIAASTWTNSIPSWGWTYVGNWTQSGAYGYGQRNVLLQSGPTPGSMTRTVSGTSIRVYYTRYTGGGGFSVYLDGSGTPALTVDTTVGATGVDDGGRSSLIPLGTRGSHTVKIEWSTGANGQPSYIGGIMVYDQDETSGIRLTEAGHSSSASSYWDQTLNSAIGSMTANITATDPDLVIIELGGNDMFQSRVPADFKASMVNIISQVRTAKPSVAILVLMMYEIVGSYAYPWSDYAGKARELVAGDTGLALLDLGAYLPTTATTNSPYGLLYDGLHPSDVGHDVIARRIADYLTGPVPGPHADAHAIGGSDPLTASAIGAAAGTTPTSTKTSAYTAALSDLVLVDASSGPITITLPVITANGQRVAVKKIDTSANVVTVAAGAGNTIGSASASSVPIRLQDQAVTYQAYGANWVIPHSHLGLPSLDARFAPMVVAPRTATASTTYSVDGTVAGNLALTCTGDTVITPTGTPTTDRMLLIECLASGAARTPSVATSVVMVGVTSRSLTLSASGKVGLFGLRYSALRGAWELIAAGLEA